MFAKIWTRKANGVEKLQIAGIRRFVEWDQDLIFNFWFINFTKC